MNWILRAAAVGAGFGLAAAAIDLWIWFMSALAQRMAPGRAVLAQSALIEIALGAVLGLSGAILLRSQRRSAAFLHLVWLCVAWFLVECWIWVDAPVYAFASFARPMGAAALMLAVLLLERWAWRRSARLLYALASLAAVAGVFGPSAYLFARAPAEAARDALPPARSGAPDVVLVVLDTVRADRMSSYGHTRDTSPTFDALAREGAWFADATSPSTWSLPSHASLFTGRYPTGHGATWSRSALDDRYPTLAEVLAARGYETLCFTANPWISDGLGLTRGFAVQELAWMTSGSSFTGRLLDRLDLGLADKGGGLVVEDFAAWRRARAADARPAFVFLNFLEAHVPYHKIPDEYRDRYTDLPASELRRISLDVFGQGARGSQVDVNETITPVRAMYDGGVAYTDELLRRVVEALRESGTLDRTVLVVLSDHGEVLGERQNYFGHGPAIYQLAVHVPLLVRYPPRVAAGTRVESPVSTLGVFATIMDLAEIEPPPTLQVGSLVRTADDGYGGPILAEIVSTRSEGASEEGNDPLMRPGRHLRAYRSGSWKLVETSLGGRFLFDLARDPTEARDLAPARPDEVKRLAEELEAARARLGLPKLEELGVRGEHAPAAELDADTEQRLRELGYIK